MEPALFAVAVGLVLLASASWVWAQFSVRAVAIERAIGICEVQEDAPVLLHFTVTRCPWLPVQVEIANYSGGWLPVKGGEAWEELRICRPGEYLVAPTTVRLRDPIGLFERRVRAGATESLLVLPAPQGRVSAQPSASGPGDELELQGLRPYAPGTPITRIHWPALARGAGLHVRHLAAPPGGLPLVTVETAGAASSEALDWTARTAAGYILTLARNGGCRALLPGDAKATTVIGSGSTWHAIHRRLAMLGDRSRAMPAPVANAEALRVRAKDAPTARVPPAPLPDGVLVVARCEPSS
jgi:uncharacterized protein (DUF58 family)